MVLQDVTKDVRLLLQLFLFCMLSLFCLPLTYPACVKCSAASLKERILYVGWELLWQHVAPYALKHAEGEVTSKAACDDVCR